MTEETRRLVKYDNLEDFLTYATKAEIRAYIVYLRAYSREFTTSFFLNDGTEIYIGTKIN